jgi:electron transport complex protein RnfB
MWIAILTLTVIALIAGLGLGFAARKLPSNSSELVERGYPGCRPYAAAIVEAGEAINLCPPGGNDTVRRLADLLGRDTIPQLATGAAAPAVAVIDESLCIGCTYCRAACPVDAIVGTHQLMHTVIEQECTGCELCLAPCPVDCISMRAS